MCAVNLAADLILKLVHIQLSSAVHFQLILFWRQGKQTYGQLIIYGYFLRRSMSGFQNDEWGRACQVFKILKEADHVLKEAEHVGG